MSTTEYAEKIFSDVLELGDMDSVEKYNLIHKKYDNFTKTFAPVVKYMTHYSMFDSKLFTDLVNRRDLERPSYRNGFRLQTDYIKELLLKRKYSRLEAIKISNQEHRIIMDAIDDIEKFSKKKEREFARDKKLAMIELRRDFIKVINGYIDEDQKNNPELLQII